MALVYKDRVKETTTTTGTGTLTLAGAVSGYQAFSAVGNANTCIYGLEASDGGWEVGIGTYTLSGTTLARTTILASSASGSAITLPAGTHNVYVTAESSALRNGFLRNKAEFPTTAGVTGEVGTMHVLDVSGLTADRDFTLPAVAAVGDRVGVMLSVGDATYELLIKPAAGDTINGGSAGDEWSRLFITGEVVIFRCVTADSAWVVEHDGRIPCIFTIEGSITLTTSGAWVTTDMGVLTVTKNRGDAGVVASDAFVVRRANVYSLTQHMTHSNAAVGKIDGSAVSLNTTQIVARWEKPGSSGATGAGVTAVAPFVAGDSLTFELYQNDTTSEGIEVDASVMEIL